MSKKYKIDNAVADFVSIFEKAGYSKTTIANGKRNIQKVVEAHHEQGEEYYNSEITDCYISKINNLYESGTISKSYKNALIKSALYVREMAITGRITPGSKEIPEKLSLYYRDILERIKESEDWGEGSKRNIVYAAHTYFLFLMDSDIQVLCNLNEDTVRDYIISKAPDFTPYSMDTIRRSLKHLHKWLYDNRYISSSFSEILSFTTPLTHHIRTPVPHDEVALMLRAIDRDKSIGKRDYAMLILATVTGMRSVDILALKFSDIDWINGEIRIIQQKTDVPLALPLTMDVGEAIKDYILNGRPRSDTEIIFLRSRPPFQPLGRRGLYSAFNNIRKNVGLGKRPFHDLRRTVGTSMVVAGIPVTTVAQVLGHSDISATKQYISLDSIHLKECALTLDGIASGGGNV